MSHKTRLSKILGDLFVVLRRADGAQPAAHALRGLPRTANRSLRATEQALTHGAAFIALGMMLLTVTEISMRKLAGYSIEGVFEGVELMLVAIVYLGLAHVQHLGRNVRVELLLTRVPFKVRQALEAFTMLLALAFFSVAIWMTGKEAWASWLIKETTFLPAALPIYVARGVITIGFFFLWLRLLIQIGERIYTLIGKSGGKSASIDKGG